MKNTKPPYDLRPGEERELIFALNAKKLEEGNILCDIIYCCELNYKYKATIKGKHGGIDILPGVLLSNQEIESYNI